MEISIFCESITTLEKTVNFLPETRKEIIYVQDKLNKISGLEADEVKEKCRLCFSESKGFEIMCEISCVLWSSGQNSWLRILRSRVRFPALPDFLRSSGSGTGSTQPREDN
jgi:hypothetical protein